MSEPTAKEIRKAIDSLVDEGWSPGPSTNTICMIRNEIMISRNRKERKKGSLYDTYLRGEEIPFFNKRIESYLDIYSGKA